MLPKKNRLDLKKEFFEIEKEKNRLRGKFFDFLFFISKKPLYDNFQPPAFAFIVSKKIDKRATKRNRIKRVLSEAVRVFLPKIKPGVKGVFLAKKEILEENFAEIKNAVELVFKEGNLFK